MRVLSVTHGPTVGGGVFDALVEESGHSLERWVVPEGDVPKPPGSYDAVLVFGGSMHPDQDEHFPWLPREADFLREALRERVPTLGVCLGAQLLARAADAWVGPAAAKEVGWHEVALTQAGRDDPVLSALGERVHAFQWHHYAFAIPVGGAELASSPVSPQAFRVGLAWGVQFHAEVTASMVTSWVDEDPHDLDGDAAALLAETASRIDGWNERGRALCAAFLEVAAGERQG